jgi:hypothetical protein
MKPALKLPRCKHLKLESHETLSKFAFKSNLRRFTGEAHTRALLVVPANVVSNWHSEFKKWLPAVDADADRRPGAPPAGLTLDSVYALGLGDEPRNPLAGPYTRPLFSST